MAVLSLSAPPSLHAQTESRGDRDASGMREVIQSQDKSEAVTWRDVGESFDRASASWLQIYGEGPFLQAKHWAEQGSQAMRAQGWVPSETSLVIAMLDGRGDQAESQSGVCRAQVNIDEKASSPVIRALGGFGSSLSFIAAHELAHCRFDALADRDRLPTRVMFGQSVASSVLVSAMMRMMAHPNASDGSAALHSAYDESLADAAATMALMAHEQHGGRYGSALERAESVRFGALAQAIRRKGAAEAHQGAFVFSSIAALPSARRTWNEARRVALQSVLATSFLAPVPPRWFETLAEKHPAEAKALARQWRSTAQKMVAGRNLDLDEDRYLSASSPALFAMSVPEGKGAYQDAPEAAMQRWKQFAWIGVETQEVAQAAGFKRVGLVSKD